ncbi:MAG: DUF898 domain-containing protein [Saprospiraceae bacterium]|nr:DUF898 domain-containing protein [Saprospiraceae bacterium]MBP7699683.1 DUF898 domain-containing protein [Saprospiraceae bacterium]
MESFQRQPQTYKLKFNGAGSEYFGIFIVNWLFMVLTLGLYYPWAKVNHLQFLYGNTTLQDEPFTFQGTGKEMFKGFIKVLLLFAAIFAIAFLIISIGFPTMGIIFIYLSFIAIIPFALHGAYRYRLSRTTWRGIRMGYRGERSQLMDIYFKGLLFTALTFGIYGAWLAIDMRNYLVGNSRLGNVDFESHGKGGEYLWIIIKGYLLTIITLGLYFPWWQKDMFAYYVNNITLHKGNDSIQLQSVATGGGFFKLILANIFILIFTLGLGYPWVVTRTMKYIIGSIYMDGDIDMNTISQTEESYKDATGEDLVDFFDTDLII